MNYKEATPPVPAPVSLAEIKAKGLDFGSFFGDAGYVRLTPEERDALVELAEAWLAVRDLDALPASEIPNRPIGEYRHALDRLYAAAKQVRP